MRHSQLMDERRKSLKFWRWEHTRVQVIAIERCNCIVREFMTTNIKSLIPLSCQYVVIQQKCRGLRYQKFGHREESLYQ